LDRVKYEKGQVPEDLKALLTNLRKWRSRFVLAEQSDDSKAVASASGEKKSKKRRSGLLTKKESKQKASNWERLKANMSK
jgi:hypothetical protein